MNDNISDKDKKDWDKFISSNEKLPDKDFKYKWETTKVLLKNELIDGKNIVLHCRGGKGRAGTIAAILLVEFNYEKQEAIDLVRSRRKGAIESKIQEDFIFSYRAVN